MNEVRGEPVVSCGQAARYLGVSRRTVYEWVRTNRLPALNTMGGHARIPVRAIEELIAKLERRPQ